MTDRELYDAALEATRRAHAPNSGLHVGAVLETRDGSIYPGANVEFATHGLTICAERVALVAAVGDGHRHFRRIGVARADRAPISPCGACRQALADFAPMDVVMPTPRGVRSVPLLDLLPHPFRLDMA